MKKLIVFLCSVLLLLSALGIAAGAAEEKYPADEMTYTIQVGKHVDIQAVGIDFVLDTDVFEIVEGSWLVQNALLRDFKIDDAKAALLFQGAKEVEGDIFTLTLRVKENAALGDTAVYAQIQLVDSLGGRAYETLTLGQYTVLCRHSFTETVIDDAYVSVPASCTQYGVYHYSCAHCGEAGSETFVSELILPHEYDDGCDDTCNTCGEITREAPHDWGEIQLDADNHWYTCDDCGAQKEFDTHSFSSPCDVDCNVCGAEKASEESHTYATEFSTDETSHWYACILCGSKKDETAHLFDDECDGLCETCLYERTPPHSLGTEYATDGENHWYDCGTCHEKIDFAAHGFDGVCDDVCDTCGYVRPAVPHNYAEPLSHDDAAHWAACTECGYTTEPEGHLFDNGCDTTCNACPFERVTEHVYDGVCDGICNECLEAREAPHRMGNQPVSNAVNHWYGCTLCSYKTGVAPHEYDDGCDTTCNGCTAVRRVEHPWGSEYVSDGAEHWLECTNCHEKKDVNAHGYDSDCDATCTECGFEREAPHVWDTEYTHENGEVHWIPCLDCGATRDMAAHVYDNDCDTGCNDCFFEREAPHAWGTEYVHGNGAIHWIECTACDAVKSEDFHTYDDGCDEICNDCGYVREALHLWNGLFAKDDVNHWIECDGCHKKKDETAHLYHDVCDADCNDCGYVREAPHQWGEQMEKNDDSHWMECALCHATKSVAAHGYTDVCDKDCNDCGYLREAPHVWNTEYSSDGENHWIECSLCHTGREYAPHVYTDLCDAVCDVCEYERVAPHVVGTEYVTDENGHWYECAACNARAGEEAHSWESTVTQKPENGMSGERLHVCTACGVNKRELIPEPPAMVEKPSAPYSAKNGGTLVFRSDAPFSEFIAVCLNGNVIPAEHYTVTEGSTVVELKEAYLATLAAGRYTLTIQSERGDAEATFLVVKASGSTDTDSTEPGGSSGSTTEPPKDTGTNPPADKDKTDPKDSSKLTKIVTIIVVVIGVLAVTGITVTILVLIKRKKKE